MKDQKSEQFKSELGSPNHGNAAFETVETSENKEPDEIFKLALQNMDRLNFAAAETLWAQYIAQNTGMPHFEEALFHYSKTLFLLGKYDKANVAIRQLIQVTPDSPLGVDGRILYLELLIKQQRYKDAVTLTYDLIPDKQAEGKAGLYRRQRVTKVTDVQKIKLLTLRARIFASLGRQKSAELALKESKALIDQSPELSKDKDEKGRLLGNWAWRHIEVLEYGCEKRNPAPVKLSESKFLDYAKAYYHCAKPVKSLFCIVEDSKNQVIRGQALEAYRSFVKAPLNLKRRLPPSARYIKKTEQKEYYEKEMKELIDLTVEKYKHSFDNIDSCNALHLL